MTKHKTMFVWGLVLFVVLAFGLFHAMPGLAQSRPDKIKNQKTPDISPAASLIEAERAGGLDTKQFAPLGTDNATTESAGGVDTLFNCTWTSAPVYPITILDQAMATVGTTLYSFGGVSTSTIASAFKFDGATWTAIAPLPAAVEFPAAVTDGTVIYLLGGANSGGTPTATLTRYDPVANTYTPLAPFTTGTWNHCAIFLNNKIYKFCGTGPGTSSTAVLEIYDVVTNTWSAGPAYPIAESFVSCWTQGGFIYGAGGINSPATVATLKTYRLDPANLGAGWDDAAIADLPLTRWGAATAFYSPDVVLAGGYVNGVVTANISNTVISWDAPSNTWQAVPNMLGERSRLAGAVLNGSFYAVGGRSVASPSFVGTNDNQKLNCINVPTNILSSGGKTVDSAGANGTPDPAETVTVSLGVLNVGGPGTVCTTGALTGTLLPGGGVNAPSGPQTYGAICSGSPAVFRSFTFTVDPATPCGSTVTASLQMQDGATNYGTLTFSFVTGSVTTSYTENFDGVVVPALPAGWTTTFSGTGAAVTTSTTFVDTAPNDIFLTEGTNVGLSEVASSVIAVPAGGVSKLSFRNLFNTEPGFDGLVLEIKIGAGAFQDILTAGGTFATNGYNSTLSTGFQNPLPGRMAWTGLSGGTAAAPTYITTVVNLPAAASGQNIQLMWRQGSDNSVAPTTNPGSRVDTISMLSPVCGGTAPAVTTAVSSKVHGGGAGTFNVTLPQVALTGPVGIEDRTGGGGGNHQVIVTFASPVTVGSASVTAGSIGSSTVIGNVVTLNLTGVANAQRLGISLSNVSAGPNLGSVMIPMGVLLGDSGGNASVNASDTLQTKARIGQTLDNTNFKSDVNINGGINAGDVLQIKAQIGTALP